MMGRSWSALGAGFLMCLLSQVAGQTLPGPDISKPASACLNASEPLPSVCKITVGDSQVFIAGTQKEYFECTVSSNCLWNFTISGEGSFTVITSANFVGSYTHVFNTPGTYTYFVSVGNSTHTSEDSVSGSLVVRERPEGTLTFTPSAVLVGQAFTVTGTYTSGGTPPAIYQWFKNSIDLDNVINFRVGQGLTSSASRAFEATDLASGRETNITLILLIYSSEDAVSHEIYADSDILLRPNPTVTPTFSPSVSTVGATVTLSSTNAKFAWFPFTHSLSVKKPDESTVIALADITSNDTAVSASHVFAHSDLVGGEATSFFVESQATDVVGTVSSAFRASSTITINPVAVPTVMSNTSVLTLGLPLGLTTTVIYGTPPYTYEWTVVASDNTTVVEVVDTTTTSAASAAASFTFLASHLSGGARTQFNVLTKVTDSVGVSSTDLLPVLLTVDPLPTANVAFSPTQGSVGDTVSLNVSSISGADGSFVVSAVLVRSDGMETALGSITTATGVAVFDHVFVAADAIVSQYRTTFTVKVDVTDYLGATTSSLGASNSLDLLRRPVAEVAFSPTESTVGRPITLNGSNVVGDSPPYTFTWEILLAADGSVVDNTLPSVTAPASATSESTTYTFSAGSLSPLGTATEYDVRLMVTDSEGATSELVVSPFSVTINPPPVVNTVAFAVLETTATVSVQITATAALGTGAYVYSFEVMENTTETSVTTWTVAGGGSVSTDVTVPPAALIGASSSFKCRVFVTDTVGASSSVLTTASLLLVNEVASGECAYTRTAGMAGVPVTLNAAALTGGTGDLTVSWTIKQGGSVVEAGINAATTALAAISSPYTFASAQLVASSATVFTLELVITDEAGVTTTVSNLTGITIQPAFEGTVVALPIDAVVGESVSLLASWTGGVAPFSLTWASERADGQAVGSYAPTATPSATSSSSSSYAAADLVGGLATQIGAHVILTDSHGNSVNLTNATALTLHPRPSATLVMAAESTVSASVPVEGTLAIGLPGGFTYTWTVTKLIGGALVSSFGGASSTSSFAFASGDLTGGASTDFIVTLTMTDSKSFPSTAVMQQNITVNPLATASVFPFVGATTVGEVFTLGTNVSGGTQPLTYTWFLMDSTDTNVVDVIGGAGPSSSPSVGISPTTPGTWLSSDSPEVFRVRMQVTDGAGVSQNFTSPATLAVNPRMVAAMFAAPVGSSSASVVLSSGVAGGSASFTFSYQIIENATGTVLGTSASTTQTAVNHSISYVLPEVTQPEVIRVQVTVTDSVGAVSTSSLISTLYPRPSAIVAITPSLSTATATVTFVAASLVALPGSMTYAWSVFNNGTQLGSTISGNNYNYSFASSDVFATTVFSVSLALTDSAGVGSTTPMEANVTIHPVPNATVGATTTSSVGVPVALSFSVVGGISPFVYTWTVEDVFGNVNKSGTVSGPSPSTASITFASVVNASQDFRVKMTAMDARGVLSSLHTGDVFTINAPPAGTFSLGTTGTTVGVNETYTASFGGGTGSNLIYTFAFYPVNGTTGNVSSDPSVSVSSTSSSGSGAVTFAFLEEYLGGDSNRSFQVWVTVEDEAGGMTTVIATDVLNVASVPTAMVAVAPAEIQLNEWINITVDGYGGTSPLATYTLLIRHELTSSVLVTFAGSLISGGTLVRHFFNESENVFVTSQQESFVAEATVTDAAGASSPVAVSASFGVLPLDTIAGYQAPIPDDAVTSDPWLLLIILLILIMLMVLCCAALIYFLARYYSDYEEDKIEDKKEADEKKLVDSSGSGEDLGRAVGARDTEKQAAAKAQSAPTLDTSTYSSGDDDNTTIGPVNEWDANYRAMTGGASQAPPVTRTMSYSRSHGYVSKSYQEYQASLPQHLQKQRSGSLSSVSTYSTTEDLEKLFDQTKRALVDYTDEIIEHDDALDKKGQYRLHGVTSERSQA